MITNEICTGGVIRRLEDLNRITIPKDICIKAKIKNGDALKIYCTEEGDIILRPYDKYALIRENIKKADEALQAVSYFIDDAVQFSIKQVRILHGTGWGILRQRIREYLNTLPDVKSFKDEHIQLGGAGITVIELY